MLSLLAHAFTPNPSNKQSATKESEQWELADVQLLGYKDLGRIYIRRDGDVYYTKCGRTFAANAVYLITPANEDDRGNVGDSTNGEVLSPEELQYVRERLSHDNWMSTAQPDVADKVLRILGDEP